MHFFLFYVKFNDNQSKNRIILTQVRIITTGFLSFISIFSDLTEKSHTYLIIKQIVTRKTYRKKEIFLMEEVNYIVDEDYVADIKFNKKSKSVNQKLDPRLRMNSING